MPVRAMLGMTWLCMRAIALVLVAACSYYAALPHRDACVTGAFFAAPGERHARQHVLLRGQLLTNDELEARLYAEPEAAPLQRASHRRWLVTLASFFAIPAATIAGVGLLPPHPTSAEMVAVVFGPTLLFSAIAGYTQITGDNDHYRAIEAYAHAENERCWSTAASP
jgi:hypothetical protein